MTTRYPMKRRVDPRSVRYLTYADVDKFVPARASAEPVTPPPSPRPSSPEWRKRTLTERSKRLLNHIDSLLG